MYKVSCLLVWSVTLHKSHQFRQSLLLLSSRRVDTLMRMRMSGKHLVIRETMRGSFAYYKHLVTYGDLMSATACQKRRCLSYTHTVVDLRSDTKTHPTDRMREAMKNAVVGDDVSGEDPTVNELQERAANILGKEAALLVPTCTMANVASDRWHGGCTGVMSVFSDRWAWRLYWCVMSVFSDRCGVEAVLLCEVNVLARKHNLLLHLDGARIFNAAVALGVPAADIAQHFDTVAVAFTKGLCCPVGSIIAGPKSFIDLARKARKALGGGMRQAGVIAAPMLVALEHMIPRLAHDHHRALRIATAINSMHPNPVCSVDLDGVHSNIVMVNMQGKVSPLQFSQRMQEVTGQEKKSLGQSVSALMGPYSPTTVRYVTHNDISDADVDKVITKFLYVIEELSSV